MSTIRKNVGSLDRNVRIVLGVGLLAVAGAGLFEAVDLPLLGIVAIGLVGALLAVTGATRTCPAYSLLGIRSMK